MQDNTLSYSFASLKSYTVALRIDYAYLKEDYSTSLMAYLKFCSLLSFEKLDPISDIYLLSTIDLLDDMFFDSPIKFKFSEFHTLVCVHQVNLHEIIKRR